MSQIVINVPAMMFMMNTFGYSSLVLYAKTLRIQTFWVIRQKVTYTNMTKPKPSCMSPIRRLPLSGP